MRILFLGHSLVEFGGWERRLANHSVVSLGRAGETTSGLLGRLDRVIAAHPAADAALVMTGTNDLLAGDDLFTEDCGAVARRLRSAYPAARIVLHGLLPVDSTWVPRDAVVRATVGIGEVAAREGVEFLDLADRFADAGGRLRRELYDADGVHLSEEGYRVWAAVLEGLLAD